MDFSDSGQAGSNLFQVDPAQGSAEQWQVNNGGFGPVRPPVMGLFTNFKVVYFTIRVLII